MGFNSGFKGLIFLHDFMNQIVLNVPIIRSIYKP